MERPTCKGWAGFAWEASPGRSSPGSESVLSIKNLSKSYANGFKALDGVDLDVRKGEIFALLGPNGAGKTTLINIVCGIVNATSGEVRAVGADIRDGFRITRSAIGLVPQELHTDAFESVITTLRFSRGLFGKPRDDAHLEKVLRDLSLWDKRDSKIMTLSGGMKRRVLIAKALSHEPTVLFLDEPTAGVDVALRRDMWAMVRRLRENGVTIILTTHYIEEAQEMADRIGVINKGKIILVEDKATLMRKLGKKQLTIELVDGTSQSFTLDADAPSIADILRKAEASGVDIKDIHTHESSLEDIFVDLVREKA